MQDAAGRMLRAALAAAMRPCPIPGMEGERVPDPVASSILAGRAADLDRLGRVLEDHGVRALSPLDGGVSAVVFDAGAGRVLRLVAQPLARGRTPIAEMLQPEAAGNSGSIHYEILPKVETASITEADVAAMAERLAARGMRFSDAGRDNLGRLPDGAVVVIDRDAIAGAPPGPLLSEPSAALAVYEDVRKGEDRPGREGAAPSVAVQLLDGRTVDLSPAGPDLRELPKGARFRLLARPEGDAPDRLRPVSIERLDRARGRGVER